MLLFGFAVGVAFAIVALVPRRCSNGWRCLRFLFFDIRIAVCVLILDHGKRVHSIYSRLSDVKVKVGATVAKGSTIALHSVCGTRLATRISMAGST